MTDALMQQWRFHGELVVSAEAFLPLSDCFLISGRRQSEWVKQDSGVVYGAPSAETLPGAPDIA